MTSISNARSCARDSLAAGMVLHLTAGSALAQQLGGAKTVEVPVIQLIAGLVLCSLAAFAIALLLRRRVQSADSPLLAFLKGRARTRSPSAGVRVMETHRLSVHADLCRFTAANREYLVILSAGAVTVLRDEPSADKPTGANAGSGT